MLNVKKLIGLHDESENNKMDSSEETNANITSSGVFLVQCLLNDPESTAVKHLLPPAKLDNNIDGEITTVQFW